MRPRPPRLMAAPMVVQVAAWTALAVVLAQATAFAVVLLSPEPRPSGFSLGAAVQALKGEPARTTDGRRLVRRVADRPAGGQDPQAGSVAEPVAGALAQMLARSLEVPPEDVRVAMAPSTGRPLQWTFRRTDPSAGRPHVVVSPQVRVQVEMEAPESFVAAPPTGSPPNPVVVARGTRVQTAHVVMLDQSNTALSLQSDQLTFGPFSVSVRRPDGRWDTVEPPRDLLTPWQKRILTALGLGLVLLAPLVWWMARRLTRPIRAFAAAAERLGADPDADPLIPAGPAEVRTAVVAFNDMQSAIRAHVRQRAQTLAAVAHDLRTPLTRLRFRAEQTPERLRDRMAADIEEMDALIAQALTHARGERAAERREALDLSALAADCAAGFSETGVAAAFEPGAPPLPVNGDPAALRRALDNLVANAVKFAGAAHVRAMLEDGRAVVTVSDSGPGLAEDELEAVFEPYRRGERSRNRETGGAGLGLTVARQTARAHGGDITLSNRPGGGLEARLVLPLSVDPA